MNLSPLSLRNNRSERNRNLPGDGTDIDYSPLPRFAHNRNDGAVHIHHAEKVRVKKALGVLGLCELNCARDAEARIVDEHIYLALASDYLIDRFFHCRFVCHIGDEVVESLDTLRAAAEFINGISRIFKRERGLHAYA